MKNRFGAVAFGCTLSLVVCTYASAQVVLSEIMFNAPDEYYEEFIEFYNTSSVETVNLTGYLLGDQLEQDSLVDAGNGLLLAPGQFALVLDPGYGDHSTIYDALIPPDALVLTIADNAFGAYGLRNDPPDTVVLVNGAGNVIASYAYTADNPDGISEEKILLSAGDDPDNWSNSLNVLGTPGFLNSVTPPSTDLELTGLSADPSPAPYAHPLTLTAYLHNLGQNITGSGSVIFAAGSVEESLPDTVIGDVAWSELPPFDSTVVCFDLDALPPGPHRLYAWHTLPDDHPENDSAQTLVIVGYPEQSLLINEIYAVPLEGQCEWLELYNPGAEAVNIFGFQLSDSDTSIRKQIADTTALILPASFAVLAEDSLIFSYDLPAETVVIVMNQNWRALNNDGDTPTLFDAAGAVQDAVPYAGGQMIAGMSLERIYLDGPSADPANWQVSYDSTGSTPGRMNSYGTQTEPSSGTGGVTFSPDPFDPDRQDVLSIGITMPSDASAVAVIVFDLRGRGLKTIFEGDFPPYPILWDGRDYQGRRLIPGLYILFVEFKDSVGDRLAVLKKTLVIAGRF